MPMIRQALHSGEQADDESPEETLDGINPLWHDVCYPV